MKFIVFIALSLSASVLMACKKDDKKPATTTPAAQEGQADITLTLTNGQLFQLNGPCGWATSMGVNYIGANHAANNLKVFEATFNLTELPSQTTTYTLVDNQFDEDPTHIWMTLTEIMGSSYVEWTSHDASGTLTLVVDGNHVTANLNGITLEAGSNAAPYNASGVLSGTLSLYK